jgi:PDZ domain-containing protein
VITGGVLLAAGVAASQYHPAVLLLSPGPVVDVTDDVVIDGAPVHRPNGRYLLTSVRVTRPSLLELGFLGFRGQVEVVPVRSNRGETSQLRRDGHAEFRASQTAAAAAGVRAAGLDPTVVRVLFRDREVIGPSAGLVYALLVNDLLTPGDLTAGRLIAATGTIDADGGVGLVGGIAEKATGLNRFGGSLLLLPIDQLVGAGAFGVAVIGVGSLADAVTALRSA